MSPGHPPLESAQLFCGCREVGERAGECPHVVVEYLPIDVVDAIARLVVTGVIVLASLAAPGFGLRHRLPLLVAVRGGHHVDVQIQLDLLAVGSGQALDSGYVLGRVSPSS